MPKESCTLHRASCALAPPWFPLFLALWPHRGAHGTSAPDTSALCHCPKRWRLPFRRDYQSVFVLVLEPCRSAGPREPPKDSSQPWLTRARAANRSGGCHASTPPRPTGPDRTGWSWLLRCRNYRFPTPLYAEDDPAAEESNGRRRTSDYRVTTPPDRSGHRFVRRAFGRGRHPHPSPRSIAASPRRAQKRFVTRPGKP